MNYEFFRLIADVAELFLVPLVYFLWRLERRVFAIELKMNLAKGHFEKDES